MGAYILYFASYSLDLCLVKFGTSPGRAFDAGVDVGVDVARTEDCEGKKNS